jgi:hypothetical protein
MATVKYNPQLNLTTLKEGDIIDFGDAGQFTKTPTGGFSPVNSAKPPLTGNPPPSAPTDPNIPAANPTSSILPSQANSGVITSDGAQSAPSASSAPATPAQAGSNPAQPNVSLVGQAFTQPIPQPPSMQAILATSNIPQMQTYLGQIQQTKLQLNDAYKASILKSNGQGTPQGIVDALSNETAKNFQIQMDSLNEAEQLASTNLSNAMTYVNMHMSAASTDYQTAISAYDDQFNRAYQMQGMFNQVATSQQNNASAYLTTVGNMISTTGVNWASVSPAMKATIQAMEAQAGWPAGTLETFAKVKPGANILGTVNGVDPTTGNQTMSIVYSGADGQPSVVKTLPLPSKPVSLFSSFGGSGGSSGGYGGEILQGTGLDPNSTVSQIINNPTSFQTLVTAMTAAEGGPNAAGAQYNNPLDLKYTAAMKAWGATDSGVKATDGGTFAAFPDQQTAMSAYKTQFSQPGYANLTLDQALQQWSGKASSSGSNSTVQSYADQVLNGNVNLSSVPNTGTDRGLRDAVTNYLNTVDPNSVSPLAARRLTMSSNAIVSNYIKTSAYQMVNNALPYLSRIDAAAKDPGSVSDQELLDSLTKIDTGGGVISDAQVKIITDGQSFSDMLGVLGNKLQNGGVLSDSQRSQMVQLAHLVYQGYQKIYQPIYEQATQQLQAANIPKPFWTIPDLNNMSAQAGYPMDGTSANGSSTPQTIAVNGQSYNVGSTVTVGGTTYLINADGTVTPQ